MPALDPQTDLEAIRARLAQPDTPLVACLCAAWCGTCRDYRQVFDTLAAAYPQACFVWVDIETHSDWVDEHDIENFPTLLVQDAHATHFFGTVLPHAGVLRRMLDDPATMGAPKPHAPALHRILAGAR